MSRWIVFAGFGAASLIGIRFFGLNAKTLAHSLMFAGAALSMHWMAN